MEYGQKVATFIRDMPAGRLYRIYPPEKDCAGNERRYAIVYAYSSSVVGSGTYAFLSNPPDKDGGCRVDAHPFVAIGGLLDCEECLRSAGYKIHVPSAKG